MIKLTKLPKPQVLEANADKWTKELMTYVNSGNKIPETVKNRYNQTEVKETLKRETHCKCMYCESYISAVSPEHIEHYRPKALYPEKTFEWENLGLSCPWCNIKKKDEFDENCAVINPYYENPNDFFISLGTMIVHKPGNKRAELSENLLELNRPELLECRKNAINNISPLLDRYKNESNPTLKRIIKENIEKEMTDEKPYAMCIRAYVCASDVFT
jgi:uncharacterized protein (TIGR02646 family)